MNSPRDTSDKVVYLPGVDTAGSVSYAPAFGGGGGDGMDPRVDVLQNDVHHLRQGVADLRTDLRNLDSKVDSHFKWQLGIYGAGVVVIIGFIYFLFEKILEPLIAKL